MIFREITVDGPSLCMCVTQHIKKVSTACVCSNPIMDWLESTLTFVFSLGISWLDINTYICQKHCIAFLVVENSNDDLTELMRLFECAGQHFRSAQQ